MSGKRCIGIGLAVVLVVVAAYLLATTLGYFVTIQKSGGWTGHTGEVDFTAEPAARIPLEAMEWGEVDNLIVLLADGAGLAHVTAARSQLVGINRLLTFERFPVTRWLDTHSTAEIYTDSAAGATALATGEKTFPGALSVAADGSVLRTLFEAARERGMVTGWVTDTYFFDASPAAFAVHAEDRDDYAGIVEKMLSCGSEIIVGEVREDYPEGEDERHALRESFRRAGYRVAADAAELAALGPAAESYLAGIFDPGVIADRDLEPHLPQLFRLALDHLAADPEGFVLLAETEEPDSGSHNGDFPRVVAGLRSLDEMAKQAVDFARVNGRTLVVVTADHETGGLSVISGGPDEPLGVRWSSTNHTAAPVPLYAFGPGATELSAVRDNTDVAPILARLLDLPLRSESEFAGGG